MVIYDLDYYIESALSSIGVIMCILVIFIYIKAKNLRVFAFKLVFWLNFYNLIRSLTFLTPASINHYNHIVCLALGYLYIFSCINGSLWTLYIAICMYQVVVNLNEDVENYYKKFLVINTIVPAILAGIPFIFHAYGDQDINCGIDQNRIGYYLRFSIYYIPTFLIIIVCSYIYLRIHCILTRINEEDSGKKKRKYFFRLFAYPLILIICVVPAGVLRGLQIFDIDPYILNIVVNSFWASQSILDALAYAMNDQVVFYLKNELCKERKKRKSYMLDTIDIIK